MNPSPGRSSYRVNAAARLRWGLLSVVLVAAVLAGAGAQAGDLPPGGTFVDDDGAVHERSIEAIAAEGITTGCNPPTNDRFCPSETVTRGQMAAFLARGLGLTDTGPGDLFRDDDDSVFEADIDRLSTAGVTRGCNPPVNDRFCPDAPVTREQMAAFLVRAIGYVDRGIGDLFVDDDGSVFEHDIDLLGAAGVTAGCNPPANDRFCPKDNVTRGQMATFLTRALGLRTTPCIPSGDHVGIQAALIRDSSKAVLCPGAVFELGESIFFTADRQQIYTEGFPKDDSRALLRVVGKDVAIAVGGAHYNRVALRNVIIDGNRPEMGIADGALIDYGRGIEGIDVKGQVVEWVKAYEPRGWTILHLNGPCTGAVARNNEFGPAGQAAYLYADGISLECPNSIVVNNTIVDATDGGIVIFQSPGSLIANNTIRTENQVMFYGISMVDYYPLEGNFVGTRVTGNVIDAAGGMIRNGIDMGPHVGCIPQDEILHRSRGAIVTDNILKGDHMGYGFVVGGVEDWTVTGNVDLSTHPAPERDVYCFGEVADPPAGFQMNPTISSGTFQEEFTATPLAWTGEFWTFTSVASAACVAQLIGAGVLEDIKSGNRGQLWPALESAENGERIGQCMSLYQPPDISDLSGDVIVRVLPCEPFCIELELINISQTETTAMDRTQFILESFPVQCLGLPDTLGPGEGARCIIEDYVTPGFQDLKWYGFPPDSGHWGINYPFDAGA